LKAAARAGCVAGAMLLGAASACSSSPSPAARGTAVAPVVSPAPTAPAGIALQALRRLHWSALPIDPLAPRDTVITAWTGHELLAVGGQRSADGAAYTGADAYDPQTGRWQVLPSLPLVARDAPASAWTGYGLFVWGGTSTPGGRPQDGQGLRDGAILDVAHRRWTMLPAGPLPALTSAVAITDAADHVIILGGQPDEGANSSGGVPLVSRRVASYDPASRTWRTLPDLPAVTGHDLVGLTAVRWGSRILAAATWQHVVHTAPGATEGNGGVDLFLLDSKQGTWSRFAVPSTLSLVGADLRPLGSQLVVAGGTMCPPFAACPASLNTAFTLLDAAGKARTGTAGVPIKPGAATDVGDNYVVMTGSQITGPGLDEQPGDTAGFDLATGNWVALPSARRFTPQPESLTWTGSELIAQSPDGWIALGSTG
jgi:hypothetical protein